MRNTSSFSTDSCDSNSIRNMRREEIMNKQHVVPGSPAGSGRCSCFPCLFLSLALAAAVILIVIFVLKPKRPSFHLHAVQLGSPEAPFSKGVNDSSAMVSLLFVAQNPNMFDIRFGSSELGLVYGSNNMGLIKVPTFFQPAQSTNISVLVHVFFEVMDLGEIVNEMQSLASPEVEVRIFGAIKAWPHVLNFALPKIKVTFSNIFMSKTTERNA